MTIIATFIISNNTGDTIDVYTESNIPPDHGLSPVITRTPIKPGETDIQCATAKSDGAGVEGWLFFGNKKMLNAWGIKYNVPYLGAANIPSTTNPPGRKIEARVENDVFYSVIS